MDGGVLKKIKLGDINPFIRIIRIHTLKRAYKTGLRYNRHYQFHYVLNGICNFHIEGNDYTARNGEMCLWAPGQVHTIAASDACSADIVGVQFDFTRNFSNLAYVPVSYGKDSFDTRYINESVEFSDYNGYHPHIRIKNHLAAEDILKTAERYYYCGGKYSEEKASSLLKEFFILLAEESENGPENNISENRQVLLEYIRDNCCSEMSNKKLAAQFGYHPVHLNRIILDLTGLSLHQYIIKLKINEAIDLLQFTDLPIKQIAEKVGYENPQYFSRLFKIKTGYTPTHFRK